MTVSYDSDTQTIQLVADNKHDAWDLAVLWRDLGSRPSEVVSEKEGETDYLALKIPMTP